MSKTKILFVTQEMIPYMPETEIAKMLSGSEITDAARTQARILLGRAAKPAKRNAQNTSDEKSGKLF